MPDEEPLRGGNVSAGVVRIGDTVRRPAGPWTPAVHALLRHLRDVGYEAPVPLGIDEQGREALSYAPGVVPWPDQFHLLGPVDQLTRVARLIRGLHDAVATFTPPPDARWQVLIPAPGGGEIIAHHDLAPWNLVIGDRWTFIDWDLAAPGSRLWDLAYAAHGFVPLSGNPSFRRADAPERLRRFVDAYGLDEEQRRDLLPLLARRTRAMYDFLAEQAGRGTEPWLTHWRTGHGDAWLADTEYITAYEHQWASALDVGSGGGGLP